MAGAPVLLGYRVVRPDGAVQNGDWVEFLTYWTGADTVWADFSGLDAVAGTAAGVYIGDSSIVVGDSIHTWPCYWTAHPVDPSNPRSDGAGIPVAVTAVSAAGDTTSTALIEFCLSNDPPGHELTTIYAPAERITMQGDTPVLRVRNGELIHLETTWNYSVPNLVLTADFSAADDSFSTARVSYVPVAQPMEGVQTHGIYYELDERAQTEDSVQAPVRITAHDGGCGRSEYTLLLELDNLEPAARPVFDATASSVADPLLPIRGTVAPGTEEIDVRIVVNGTDEYDAHTWFSATGTPTWIFEATLTLQGGPNHIVAYARDLVGNLSAASEPLLVDLRYAPAFKRWQILRPVVLDPDTTASVTVINGDVVQVRSYWDSRGEYDVSADFSAIDELFQAAPPTTRCENITVQVGDTTETWACYQFEYQISPDNPRRDGTRLIAPVTAYDPATGYSTTTQSLLFCLSNAPPLHLWTEPDGDAVVRRVRDGDTLIVVRNGATVRLVSSWLTRSRPLSARLDFSAIDRHYASTRLRGGLIDTLTSDSVGTYWFTYSFHEDACCDEGVAPYPFPVEIRMTDAGCGTGAHVISFEMDNEGPSAAPWLNPAPPAIAVQANLPVSGIAPDDPHDVLLRVFHEEADSTDQVVVTADALGAFTGSVPLLPGRNELTAYGRDEVGNPSPASMVHPIWLAAEGERMDIPAVFRPGDMITLENSAVWSEVELAIYNLEGDLIRTWMREGEVAFVQIPWDGRNGRGETVHSGPYLVRIRTRGVSGDAAEEVKPIVFER
ncbi:MAG: hypothetical protein V1774_10270 [Candidatus Eisenbacteria bacterium]